MIRNLTQTFNIYLYHVPQEYAVLVGNSPKRNTKPHLQSIKAENTKVPADPIELDNLRIIFAGKNKDFQDAIKQGANDGLSDIHINLSDPNIKHMQQMMFNIYGNGYTHVVFGNTPTLD